MAAFIIRVSGAMSCILMLLTGGLWLTEGSVQNDVRNLIGGACPPGEMGPGPGNSNATCKNCENKSFEFWECHHAAQFGACDPNACLQDLLFYWECTPKTEAADPAKCEYELCPSFVWRRQIKYSVGFNLACGPSGPGGGYLPVPNFPATGACSMLTAGWVAATGLNQGKCYLGAEDFVACAAIGTVLSDNTYGGGIRCL